MFFIKDPIITEVNFAGTVIQTTVKMKALGLILAHYLKWDKHINATLPKTNSKLSLTRKIRPLLTRDQYLSVATSQIFSTMYYAAPVWLNCTLGHKLWKKIDSFHYRVMRVAIQDFKGKKKRKVIDSLCKRATPRMWSNYISASTAIKIIRDKEPKRLLDSINTSMVIERRRPRNGRFFDGSRLLVGKHQFKNRLTHLSQIQDPWLYPTPSNDSIRTILKRHLNFSFN